MMLSHFSELLVEPVDYHHTPLLGCTIPLEKDIHTHFFHVEISQEALPGVELNGGGMASDDDILYLMTGDGEIFTITDGGIQHTGLSAPDNNLSLYQKQRAEGTVPKAARMFRYEDILALNGVVYVSYTEWHGDCYTMTIAAYEQGNWRVFYRSSPCLPAENDHASLNFHMAGGRMVAYMDDILLTVGDYTVDNRFPAGSDPQDPSTDYGKVLRINTATGQSRVFSIGHRNPQGIYADHSGTVWALEHGPRGGDELNKLVEGGNYGWPLASLGTDYAAKPLRLARHYGRHEQFTLPTYSWIPSIGVNNLIQVNGFHESWDGDFLIGTLAYERLIRLRIREGRVLFAEPLCIGRRVRYVHQHTNGKIYVWTDDKHVVTIHAPIVYEPAPELPEPLMACTECHGLDGAAGAPALHTIKENYSDERLAKYLSDPRSINPSSQMPNLELTSREIEAVIEAMKAM